MNAGFLAGLLLIASAASPASRVPVDYQGPLGLRWGQTVADARASLAERQLTFIEEGKRDGIIPDAYVLRYRGSFGGYSDAIIELEFSSERLIAVAVVMHHGDAWEGLTQWRSITGDMKSKYGAPAEPPEHYRDYEDAFARNARPPTMLLRAVRRESILKAVESNEWRPAAKWKFRNGSTISAVLRVTSSGGERTADVYWMFASERAEALMNDSVRQGQADY